MKLVLPDFMLCGYWASAPFPWLLILAKAYSTHAALIAHEQCHQGQQRRDGWLTFWYRYLTSKTHRQAYELEAYKVWLQVAPHDAWRVSYLLAHNYGLDLTAEQAKELLDTHQG